MRERALGILDVVLYLSMSAGIQAGEPLIQAAVSHSNKHSASFDSKNLEEIFARPTCCIATLATSNSCQNSQKRVDIPLTSSP